MSLHPYLRAYRQKSTVNSLYLNRVPMTRLSVILFILAASFAVILADSKSQGKPTATISSSKQESKPSDAKAPTPTLPTTVKDEKPKATPIPTPPPPTKGKEEDKHDDHDDDHHDDKRKDEHDDHDSRGHDGKDHGKKEHDSHDEHHHNDKEHDSGKDKDKEKKKPKVSNDPHFLGAHGTRFEFNGLPGEDFCLFTDRSVHINMHMVGYFDARTAGASVLSNGKAVRTWIRQLAVLYRVGGKNHSFLIAAREGPEFRRGGGFLAVAEMDRVALPALQPGESKALAGDLTFTYSGPSQIGAFETDEYTVKVQGLFSLGVTLRAAHYLLRTPDDAMTHINVKFSDMFPTAQVHGIMGQTYRDGRDGRAMKYNHLSQLLHRPVAADGLTGAGFLDGTTADYKASSIYAPDCHYSAFNGASIAASAASA